MEILTTTYMKECKKCLILKEFVEYNKYSKSKDGYRYTCKCCENERKRIKNSQNIEVRTEWRREYYNRNKEKLAQYNNNYYHSNLEKVRKIARNYYHRNRSSKKEYTRKYLKNNPHINREMRARRRAAEMQASLNYDLYKKEIKLIYKNCPEGYHVDHIIPLRGKNVCGLHVPWNLQYLKAEENFKKGNKIL